MVLEEKHGSGRSDTTPQSLPPNGEELNEHEKEEDPAEDLTHAIRQVANYPILRQARRHTLDDPEIFTYLG